MRASYLRFRLLLSNISDKMAFRIRKEKENRLKKHSKTAELFGGSSKISIVQDDKTLQCHAPIVGCICKGDPLPKSTLDGGVKMRCTNENCDYAKHLIHSECFDMLENHLIKIISNIGSARGWTELQRRHNLWEKKGLTLVQKLLRCKCDRGQMVRDTDFYKEAKDVKAIAKPEDQAASKLKKKKKKELPRLNFGYNSSVIPPSENSDLYKKKFNELESHYLSSHIDDDELSSGTSMDVSQSVTNNSVGGGGTAWQKAPSVTSMTTESVSKHRQLSLTTSDPAIVTTTAWKTVPSAAPVSVNTNGKSITGTSPTTWKNGAQTTGKGVSQRLSTTPGSEATWSSYGKPPVFASGIIISAQGSPWSTVVQSSLISNEQPKAVELNNNSVVKILAKDGDNMAADYSKNVGRGILTEHNEKCHDNQQNYHRNVLLSSPDAVDNQKEMYDGDEDEERSLLCDDSNSSPVTNAPFASSNCSLSCICDMMASPLPSQYDGDNQEDAMTIGTTALASSLDAHYFDSEFDNNDVIKEYGRNGVGVFNNNAETTNMIGDNGVEIEVASGVPSSLLSSCSSMVAPNNALMASASVQQQNQPMTYTLFGRSAPSFFLGERILAELYLPSGSFSFS